MPRKGKRAERKRSMHHPDHHPPRLQYSVAMKLLLLLLASNAALAQVTITLQKADLAALPGSRRSVYAEVEGTPNLTVNWSVTGGCTLAHSQTTAEPQRVVAPSKGSYCSYSIRPPTNLAPSFASSVSCTVTAAAAANPAITASITIPVCSEAPVLKTFPIHHRPLSQPAGHHPVRPARQHQHRSPVVRHAEPGRQRHITWRQYQSSCGLLRKTTWHVCRHGDKHGRLQAKGLDNRPCDGA